MATLIITNEEMYNIMKIVKSLEASGFLIKGIGETMKNEAKEQKDGFLSLLLVTLSATSLKNILTGKGVKPKIPGRGLIRASELKIGDKKCLMFQ